jgi:hypothetical protein
MPGLYQLGDDVEPSNGQGVDAIGITHAEVDICGVTTGPVIIRSTVLLPMLGLTARRIAANDRCGSC